AGIYRIILAAVLCAIILLAAFFVFRVHSEGRFALREAKNVRMALLTSDIEAYGVRKCIYDPLSPDGMSDAARQAVRIYAGVRDGVMLIGYDIKTRDITRFTYTTDHYLVTFDKDDDNEEWRVDYLWRIFVY
ncbi:MAG: hypothetical protein K6B44_12635, partial [Lachnospiraceae bacterium]|nr:hypothetical protein [Lachnospiraceae bacterium]